MTFNEEISLLLVSNKVGEAISLAMKTIENIDKAVYNTLILLKSQYVQNENDNAQQILSRNEYLQTKARITNGFQHIFSNLPQSILQSNIENNSQKSTDMITEKELKGYKEVLDLIIEKRTFLEKEIVKTSDADAKFAIAQRINDLEQEILKYKTKISGDIATVSKNTSMVNGNGNYVFQGVSGSNINLTIKNGLVALKDKLEAEQNEVKDMEKKLSANPIKILFMAAYPDDRLTLSSEFDEIRTKIKPMLDKELLKLLDISSETDFDKLVTRLTLEQPNILHYSGHSTEEGLCLRNSVDGNTQLIDDFGLRMIFEKKSTYLKLVFLNSCFSSNQAKVISEQGIFVLGIKNTEIEDSLAKKLAERFYLGLIQDSPISIEKAILSGCFNFAMTYSKYANLISLWRDGKEIDYKTLKF